MDQNTLLSLFTRFDDDPPQQNNPWPGSNIGGIGILQKGLQFSIFNQKHAEEAAAVYNHLISIDSTDNFVSETKHLKRKLNEGIYMYAVSVALVHRHVGEAQMPPFWQIHPKCFFRQPSIKHAVHLASHKGADVTNAKQQALKPFVTGTNRDPEFKMAWWREDCELNAHHFHWHQVYPWMGIQNKDSKKPETKDRQGELFYYMHQQMLARYDADRLGVGLMRVDPYDNWHMPIEEGYNSQMTDYYGTQEYAARPSGMLLSDIWLEPDSPKLVREQEYHHYRLLDAINTRKFIKNDGQHVYHQDVDIVSLGAAVEASISSPNSDLYGSLHNNGHALVAAITDPDGRYQQAGGVIGENATATRDPMFFRWHKFIDNLFLQHKIKLHPYSDEELGFSDIAINELQVQVKSQNDGSLPDVNVLSTYMEDIEVDISHDMFLREHEVYKNTNVCVTVNQVNHDDFKYTMSIQVTAAVKAAIRIFMAPSLDEHGNPYKLSTQRRVFIEMDKFVENLTPGTNTIERSSADSSVIKPSGLTFKQLKQIPDATGKKDNECSCRQNRYCECGWPQHMLLPRGTFSGMKFDLFVIVTDWTNDSVNTTNLDKGSSYCGVKNEKYPDSRAMGFPFDRQILKETLKEFTDHFSNMITVPISIKWVREKVVKSVPVNLQGNCAYV